MKDTKSTQFKKYRIVALLLNLFIGAGYIYIGKFKKAFFFFAAPVLLLIVGTYLEQYADFALLAALFSVLLLYLYSFADLWRSFPISEPNKTSLKYAKWYYVVSFILFGSLIQLFVSTKKDLLPTQQFTLPTSSMNNTLFKGDYIIALKQKQLKRGEIAVFRNPRNPDIHYVKRVVAVEGDELIYQDKKLFIHFHEGDAYIQKHFPQDSIFRIEGKSWVKNPYLISNPNIFYKPKYQSLFTYLLIRDSTMEAKFIKALSTQDDASQKVNAFYVKVAKDSYYMVGDNRDNSNDSRLFGSVHRRYVYGVVKNVYFNYVTWDRFHLKVR